LRIELVDEIKFDVSNSKYTLFRISKGTGRPTCANGHVALFQMPNPVEEESDCLSYSK